MSPRQTAAAVITAVESGRGEEVSTLRFYRESDGVAVDLDVRDIMTATPFARKSFVNGKMTVARSCSIVMRDGRVVVVNDRDWNVVPKIQGAQEVLQCQTC